MGVEIRNTVLSSVLIIIPNRIEDERGFFEETWNTDELSKNGIDISFVQDNHSYSKDEGTLRGLHYQAPPFAQDKLVRCTRGAVFDVAVDVRKGSRTRHTRLQSIKKRTKHLRLRLQPAKRCQNIASCLKFKVNRSKSLSANFPY